MIFVSSCPSASARTACSRQHMARRQRRPSAGRCTSESAPMQSCARTSQNRRWGTRMTTVRMAVVATMMAWSAPAFAQTPPTTPPPPDFSKVEIKTTDLGDNCYMLEGQGGNITVAVAKEGIIMVDGQFAPLHDKIKAAVAVISNLPIKYLINTHYHGDHTGGNESFARDGAIIVAQINVKNRLAAGTTNGLTGAKTPPAPQGALPSDTYTNF